MAYKCPAKPQRLTFLTYYQLKLIDLKVTSAQMRLLGGDPSIIDVFVGP